MSDDEFRLSPDRPTRDGEDDAEPPAVRPPADPPSRRDRDLDPDRVTRESPAADDPRDPDRVTREQDPTAGGDRDPHRPTREADASQDGRDEPPTEAPDRFPPEIDRLIDDPRLMPDARGGQAVLYRARLRSTGEPVVLKVFHRDDPALENVWRLWQAARHANIIPLIHAVRASPRAYEIMPLAEHGSLRQYMRALRRPLTPDEASDVLRQIGAALHYIHRNPPQALDDPVHAWVHQDVKPGNILVVNTDPLTVQLADFGIARAQEYTREAATGAMDAAYAAPEQFRRQRSPAIDWWALGMTLLEVLTGTHPFDGLPDLQINDLINEYPVPVDDPLVPESWQLLLRGLLTWSPTTRWDYDAVQDWFAGTPRSVDGTVGPAHAGDATAGVDAAVSDPRGGSSRGETPAHGIDPTGMPPDSVPVVTPDNAWADLVGAPFRFAGTTVRRPRELAVLMGNDWRASGELVAAVPRWTALLDWSSTVSPGLRAALDEVNEWYVTPRRHTDRTIAEIIACLDPAADLVFLGAPADPQSMLELARRAREERRGGQALAAVGLLYESQTLRALARHEGWSQLSGADENWHRWYDRARAQAERIGGLARVPRGWTLQAMLLSAALDTRFADAYRAQAEHGPSRRARRVAWFAELRAEAANPAARADAVAIHALMTLTASLAEEGWRPGDQERATAVARRGAVADGGADGAGADAPAELARRLRAQVDAQIAAGMNGDGWPPVDNQPLWPPVPPPVRRAAAGVARYPEALQPHAPRRLRPTAVVAGAALVLLLAVLVGIGTALSTSAAEGALAGSLLLLAAGCLSVALPPSSLSDGVLGGVAGAVAGIVPAAACGSAVGWVLGPPVGWPTFWLVWTLAVTIGAVRGAAEHRAEREAALWVRR